MRLNHILVLFVLTGAAAAQVVVTSSGYATVGGPTILPALPWVPMAQPGVITFVNASNAPAGATNATGQNLAGATNATIMNVPGASMGSTTMAIYTEPPATLEFPVAPHAPGAAAHFARRLAADGCFLRTGVMYTESAYNTSPPPLWTSNLAEKARAARQSRAGAGNVPLYTDTDLQRLRESPKGGISITGTALDVGQSEGPAQENFDRNLGVSPPAPKEIAPTAPPPVHWKPAPTTPKARPSAPPRVTPPQ